MQWSVWIVTSSALQAVRQYLRRRVRRPENEDMERSQD